MNFIQFQEVLDQELEIKEKIKHHLYHLDRLIRSIQNKLYQSHVQFRQGSEYLPSIEDQIQSLKKQFHILQTLIPDHQFYRYNHMWSATFQTSIFLATFYMFLKNGQLITPEQIEELFHVPVQLQNQTTTQFHFTFEEYLGGMSLISPELSRLAVNCATQHDYQSTIRIQRFLNELYSGFQILNLKNDHLRRKFDGMKYDVKKVEEVIYDLKLRGLV